MFLKDVWPDARIGLYCELFYNRESDSINFDSEFAAGSPELRPLKLRMENLNNHLHFNVAEAGLSPTSIKPLHIPLAFARISRSLNTVLIQNT